MADRSIAAGDTLNKLRFEFNGTVEDIGAHIMSFIRCK